VVDQSMEVRVLVALERSDTVLAHVDPLIEGLNLAVEYIILQSLKNAFILNHFDSLQFVITDFLPISKVVLKLFVILVIIGPFVLLRCEMLLKE
jgi:hypothetical protein